MCVCASFPNSFSHLSLRNIISSPYNCPWVCVLFSPDKKLTAGGRYLFQMRPILKLGALGKLRVGVEDNELEPTMMLPSARTKTSHH